MSTLHLKLTILQ